jgi:hypothetical protein
MLKLLLGVIDCSYYYHYCYYYYYYYCYYYYSHGLECNKSTMSEQGRAMLD